MANQPIRAAVIGGSGFYQMEGLSDVEELRVDTPYGPPSDAIVVGKLDGQRVAFLPRHGVGHRLLPSEIPARANIHALKQLGVEFIISVSAVGSLRQEIEPLHMVDPRPTDRPHARPPVHVLRRRPGRAHRLRGPVLSGRAGYAVRMHAGSRSDRSRRWHDGRHGRPCLLDARRVEPLPFVGRRSIIGMTALPEAKLAREAEICYGILACSTDYDVWHETEGDVTAEMIVANLLRNVEVSRRAVRLALARLPEARDCACRDALRDAIITPMDQAPEEAKRRLAPIIEKYLPQKVAGA